MVLLKLTANGAQPLSEDALIAVATGAGLIVTLMVVSSLQLPVVGRECHRKCPGPGIVVHGRGGGARGRAVAEIPGVSGDGRAITQTAVRKTYRITKTDVGGAEGCGGVVAIVM